jgi:DnaK suppressor protein
MPSLTEQQINEFNKRLKQQFDALREEIRQELLKSDNEQYIDIAGKVHDNGEESVADLLADWNIMIVDRQLKELREIENALNRISMGSYGICDECGNEIELERLNAQPAAIRCISCQTELEQRSGIKNPTM